MAPISGGNQMVLTAALVESINHWTGITVAVAGVFVTAPGGTRRRIRQARQVAATILVRSRLRKPPPPPAVRVYEMSATAEPRWNVQAQATRTFGPLEERVSALEYRADTIDARNAALEAAIRSEAADRAATIDGAMREIAGRYREIQDELRSRDRESSRVDAHGIPVLLFGTLLSNLAADLAASPVNPYIVLLLPLAAVIWCVLAGFAVFRPRRTHTGAGLTR